jgi:hypothetical protein
MTYRGYVKRGVILLRDGASLKDGTEVRVQPVKSPKKRSAAPSLGQKMLAHAGVVKGLPSDLAKNHDHYLYRRPRK